MTDPLYVHLGIVRTGSSSIRRLIRDYCQISGEVCSHFPEVGDERISDQTKYLFMECPYPYHLETQRPCLYFTTIRNPIDSVISEYFFYLERQEIDASVSLDDYIAALPKSYNKQARWIGAINSEDKSMHHIDQPRNMFENGFYQDISDHDLLNQVQVCAQKFFPILGLLERMEESAFLLADCFSWQKLPHLRRMNPSFRDAVMKREKPTERQLQKIRDCNEVDMILYQAISQNFKQSMNVLRAKFGSVIDEYIQACKAEDDIMMKQRVSLLEKYNK